MEKHRKLLILSVLLIVISIISFLTTKTVINLNHKEKIALRVKNLPDLPVMALGFNKQDWSKLDKENVLVFFNSTCEHCHNEVEAIRSKISAFAGSNLLFISEESQEKILAFSKTHKLDNSDGVWWLKMQPDDVYNTFGPIAVPHIWIYNKDGELVKEFKGETKVEAILEWL